MAVSAITESIRREKAIKEGLEDDPDAMVHISAMWLGLQYTLLGLAEACNAIGQIQFFYSQFPKSMSSMAIAPFTFGMEVSNLGYGPSEDEMTSLADGVEEESDYRELASA
ncbi:hypothetical protein F0562_007128 [Nyssa sinensis]|uniref:Uncharacterized protein n=1 Tax=Nyssa sinensis TaxID=561372 RepID=A0A5J5A311_9ASTE|nr:hypothetical protein F0562_007128 [Nyssa sinensis]